ncbi:lysozyme inhibitor LprI family protein [uncultured Roseobacter sp.]|uniref:lysozyme inhibitor LprI family protein n=1 Tax=uncultured Roseobacter sp. TaxID=114847 RepID=UPI002620C402|nr:lysozyme inhibitor LprI family protein [uncultured Roseobacter sp.]
MIRALALGLALSAAPALAQGILYSDAQTRSCLDELPVGAALSDCAGLSSAICMQANDAGHTTVGMGGCLDGELTFWDALLNETYQAVLQDARQMDAEMRELGSAAPAQAPALVAMQRAWITFRDEACAYERTKWGGGTGGGPATLQCLMELTADQTDRLSRQWGE